jgi:DNA-binding GntR family transcriptional regulator
MQEATRRNQSERAYQAIRKDIITGRHLPGQRLVESDIAARAGVSRTPVRQALQWLERDGVVRIEKRRGATLRELSAQQISDLYELRAQLESFACQLAASRANEEDRAELQRMATAFDAAVREDSGDDLAHVRTANAALHRKIAEAADNPFLVMALVATIENPLVPCAYQRSSAEELERSVLFHRLIVQSINEGEGDRAGRLMREHVLQARDILVAAFDHPPVEARA